MCRPVMYVIAHIYLLVMTGYCNMSCCWGHRWWYGLTLYHPLFACWFVRHNNWFIIICYRWLGFKVIVEEETKKIIYLLTRSLPHTVNCTNVWEILTPAFFWCMGRITGINCCVFVCTYPSWWLVLRQCDRHFCNVCPSSTSNLHEKHVFQLLWRM